MLEVEYREVLDWLEGRGRMDEGLLRTRVEQLARVLRQHEERSVRIYEALQTGNQREALRLSCTGEWVAIERPRT